jgi:hypothetical protein
MSWSASLHIAPGALTHLTGAHATSHGSRTAKDHGGQQMHLLVPLIGRDGKGNQLPEPIGIMHPSHM